jgi:hypothetical protein
MGESVEKGILKSKGKNLIECVVPAAGFVRITPL